MRFENIRHNPLTGRLEFHFYYKSFTGEKTAGDPARSWCVETYGQRIENTSDEKTGAPVDAIHDITTEFNKLLDAAGVDHSNGKDIRQALCDRLSSEQWKEFYKLLRLTLQNTNWDSASREYNLIGCTASNGKFYDSRYAPQTMPKDADVSAARALALKAHMVMRNIREYNNQNPPRTNTGKIIPVKTYISDKEWFQQVQR